MQPAKVVKSIKLSILFKYHINSDKLSHESYHFVCKGLFFGHSISEEGLSILVFNISIVVKGKILVLWKPYNKYTTNTHLKPNNQLSGGKKNK